MFVTRRTFVSERRALGKKRTRRGSKLLPRTPSDKITSQSILNGSLTFILWKLTPINHVLPRGCQVCLDQLSFPADAESDITKMWYQVGLYILIWLEREPFPIIPSERLADSWDKTGESFELHSKAQEEKPSEENKVTFSVSIGTERVLKLQFSVSDIGHEFGKCDVWAAEWDTHIITHLKTNNIQH